MDLLDRDHPAGADRAAPRWHRDDQDAFESVLTSTPDGTATRLEMRTVFRTRGMRDEAVERYSRDERWRVDPPATCGDDW